MIGLVSLVGAGPGDPERRTAFSLASAPAGRGFNKKTSML